MKCYRYIELNPVTARIVGSPDEYAWTSFHANAWGDPDPFVTMHRSYVELGQSQAQRNMHYRVLFDDVLTAEDRDGISKATHYSMPWGSDEFIQQIEREAGSSIGYA